MLLVGEIFNIFLLTGISNINIFLLKKKNNGLFVSLLDWTLLNTLNTFEHFEHLKY